MKKLIALTASLVVAAAFVGGCTQLEVRRFTGGVVEGIPYVLPKKAILVTVNYQVDECSVDENGRLKLSVRKTVSASQVVEPGETFYIPYASIRNFFKDNEVTVEAHDSSTLKSITAHSVDKTGPAITSVVALALKAASWSSNAKAAVSAADQRQKQRGAWCAKEIVDALDAIAALKQSKAEDAPAKIAEQREALKFKQVVRWVPQKAGPMSIEVYPQDLLQDKWLTKEGLSALRVGHESLADANARIPAFISEARLEVARPVIPDASLPDTNAGVVLRYPMMALLRVCERRCPTASGDATGVVGDADIVVPQLGDYFTVPLRNRIFQDQKIELTLSRDGLLEKVGINSKATAQAALENLNTNLDQIKAHRTAQEQAKEAAKTEAANAAKTVAENAQAINQAIANCLAAQKALKEAGGSPVGTCQ
jgi:hypothetical protein